MSKPKKGQLTADRQAGDYSVPILKRPKKKPIPEWTGGIKSS